MEAKFFSPSSPLRASSIHKACTSALALAAFMVLAMAIAGSPAAQAQNFQVVHNFAGVEGELPFAGLTIDAAGNMYGTTPYGGVVDDVCPSPGCGGVYRLKATDGGFVVTTLHSFVAGTDGNSPQGRVTIGGDGNLYGTTIIGGGAGSCYYPGSGCGTVFQVRVPRKTTGSPLAPSAESVLYPFTGGTDGGQPQGDLVFDQSGNIYGVTWLGGATNNGVIYQLSPAFPTWKETVLYSAQNNGDGANPVFLAIDKSGTLYGVFSNGGRYGFGTVFQLSHSNLGWTEQTLHAFTGVEDGQNPVSLIIDASGNLYGMTNSGGTLRGGTVFQLALNHGVYDFSTIYTLGHDGEGCNPLNALLINAGDLYGTASNCGEYNWGAVFKLSLKDLQYTSLHDFTFEASDGNYPTSNLIFDAKGNLFGTAQFGGANGLGVIFEITP
jgi:uncharacterized repeat protein (TIGR03803 family)